ncbi:unnamed protein product [Coffea canephora]|uniref:Histidine--tRNA ligase n=1 Tax=Coffea canephora TaxID=49390 RepID=A0A068UVL1_COFCA|nr:unnamed protein product [Coffea canephora]
MNMLGQNAGDGVTAKVVFDLSLARGLDYYIGVIFEAVFKGSTQVSSNYYYLKRLSCSLLLAYSSFLVVCGFRRDSNVNVMQVGSIAAGGRYDNLIGMFGRKQGISLGIEPVLVIMEQLQKDRSQVTRIS